MELFTYPVALIFASLMAILISTPIILLIGSLVTLWIEYVTDGSVKYTDPFYKYVDKLTDKSDILTGAAVCAGVYLISGTLGFVTAYFAATDAAPIATDWFTYMFFGIWFEFGVWAGTPLLILGIFLGVTFGSKYIFSMYRTVIERLATVESKAHTHKEEK